MQPPNPHDALFRSVFEAPHHAAGEIRHVLRPELSARIDWGTLALCSGSFVVSNPAEPVDLVKRLVGVVGKESEGAVMNVAEWLEQKGEKQRAREMLLRQMRLRFGELPREAVDRIQEADDPHLRLWTDRVITAATLGEVLAES